MSPRSSSKLGFLLGWLLAVVAGGAPAGEAPDRNAGRRISIQVAGETLAEALPRLGQAARFGVRCGENAADRRIYLYVDDRPLPEVMGRLKRLIAYPPGGALWFRSGSGSLFDEDLASLNARRAAAARLKRERLEAARKALAEVREWAAPTEKTDTIAEEKAHIKKYGVSGIDRSNTGNWLRIVELLPVRMREQALLGMLVRVPIRTLSPAAQQACVTASMGRHPSDRRPVDPRDHERTLREMRESTLILHPNPGAGARQVSLQVTLQQGGKLGGQCFPEVLQLPKAADAGGSRNFAAAYRKERRGPRGPEGMDQIPPLQRRVRFPGKNDGEAVPEWLIPAVARLARMPLIGEYDPCADPAPFVANERCPRVALKLLQNREREMPLWELLELVCEEFDLNWDYDAGWLVLRSPRTLLSWAGMADLSPLPPPKE